MVNIRTTSVSLASITLPISRYICIGISPKYLVVTPIHVVTDLSRVSSMIIQWLKNNLEMIKRLSG